MSSKRLEATDSQRVYDDIAGAIGMTPLVRLNRTTRNVKPQIFAKLELLNPGGSVKDRIGFPILEEYERSGELVPGGTVVEATSGNTGVGLAIACALKGYQAIFVMPDKMSDDKVRLLRAYGARVVITPTAVEPDDPRSYYSVAERLVEETPNAVLANQYHNPMNPRAHYESTAPEIWHQTEGKVTDIVVGMGTGGTLTGIAQFMRDQGHRVKIVGVDPQGSILYDAWKQAGSLKGLKAETYKVEGIGEDFVPSTMDLSLIDEVIQVSDTESFQWTRRLVREEGIFAGGSSGSALAGALRYARDLGPEHLIVVLFPDSGSRYLSKVFDDEWMREHGFAPVDRRHVSALEVSRARGLPTLITASPGDRVAEVIERMREDSIDQLPVVDEDGELVGIVNEVTLLNRMLDGEGGYRPDETIASMVDAKVQIATGDTPLDGVLPDLLEKKVIVLVDELRRPVGIMTIIDALEFLAARDRGETIP